MKPTRTTHTPLRTTDETTESSSEIHEQIRLRAHELFEQRGRNDGHELGDWLQAEYSTEGERSPRIVTPGWLPF
jgi:hypothetical protein